MITDDQIYVRYQPLFDHLANEHGLTLFISEMDEIILKAQEVMKHWEQRKAQKQALKEVTNESE